MFSFAQLLGPNHDVSSSSPEINQAKWTTLTVWVLKWSSKRWRSEMDVCSFDPESQTRCYSYTPCFQASNLLAILYMSGIALSSQGQCHDHKTIRNVELLATTCLDPYRALATSSHGYCENPCSKNIQWPWRSDRYRKKINELKLVEFSLFNESKHPGTACRNASRITTDRCCTSLGSDSATGLHKTSTRHASWGARCSQKEYPYMVVLNVLHILWYVMNMFNQPATATNCSFTDKRELPRYLPSCRSEQCQNMGKLELEMDALPMDSGKQTIVKVSQNW